MDFDQPRFVHKKLSIFSTKFNLRSPYAVSAPRRQNQKWHWRKESVESLETRVCFLGSTHTHTGQAVSRACYLPVSLTSRRVRQPLRCIMLRRVTSGLSDLGSQSRVLLANGFVVLEDLLQVAYSLFTIFSFNLWREGNLKVCSTTSALYHYVNKMTNWLVW